MDLNKMLGLAVAGAGVWYAFTGNTTALKVFVGVSAGTGLAKGLGITG